MRLLTWVLLGHTAFLGLVFMAKPPPLALVGAAICLMFSLLAIWRRHFSPLSPGYVRRATWRCDDTWALECGDGRCFPARLQVSGFCHTRLILLNFELGPWRRRSLLLLPDSLPPDALRQLRVRLRERRNL
jgi:hypothetical protein